MALGGIGYFATGYWNINYWHTNYWAEGVSSAVSSTLLLMKAGSILMGLSYGVAKWFYTIIQSG